MNKVLFVGVGLTHYFNKVLDKIGSDGKLEIYNAVSSNSFGHVGEGVYQEEVNHNFRIVKFEEIRGTNHYHFKGLTEFVLSNKIDTIIVSDPYLFSTVFNPVFFALKKMGYLRIFLKSIPFRMKSYDEMISANSLKVLLKAKLRRVMYDYLDGHLNYVEDGKRVYGSFGVAENKIFVTGNTPDTDLLEEIRTRLIAEGVSKRIHQFIHVGRLVEWKRVDMLIRAFNTLLKDFPEASLVIVGDGPELLKLKKLAVSLGLEKKVEFKGPIHSYETLGKILMQSYCYVLAGMGGLSINDAMAFGLPVIVSVCDGTEKDLVIHGDNGYYFQDNVEADLYQKMKDMAASVETATRLGNNSLRVIKDKVNIDTVVGKYKKALIQG